MISPIAGLGAIALLFAVSYLVMSLARYAIARAFGVRGVGLFSGSPEEKIPPRAAFAIVIGSVAATYALATLPFIASSLVGGKSVVGTIVNVIPDRMAEAAGMHSGDRVLTIAGARVETWEALAAALRARGSQPTDIVVSRAGAEVEVKVTPKDGKIGIAAAPIRVEVPLSSAIAEGLGAPTHILVSYVRGVTAVLVPREAPLSGPVALIAETIASKTTPAATVLGYLGRMCAFMFLPIGLLSLRGLTGVPARKMPQPVRGNED